MSSKSNSRVNNPRTKVAKLIAMLAMVWSLPAQSQVLPETLKVPDFLSATAARMSALKLPDTVQVHGFATQGYMNSTGNNNVFGNSNQDSGTFGFREVGLNASVQLRPNLLISAQGLHRHAGQGSQDIRLDYGVIDYKAYSGENSQFGIRLGRIKNPLGFYNETRDVAHTRPSIMLPQSIYFDRSRNLAMAADGGHVYGETRTSKGDFFYQFGVVMPYVGGTTTEAALLGSDRAGHLTSQVSYIGRGIYEYDGGRVRLAVSGAQTNVNYNRGADPALLSGQIQFTPIIFSAQYNAERWSLTSEYAIRHTVANNFGVALPNSATTGESYYFQGIYRFTPKWEGVIRYDALYTNRDDRHGHTYAAASPATRDPNSRFAKDITTGIRWNVTPSFMLAAEHHYVNGTAWLAPLDNPGASSPAGHHAQHWHLFAVQGSFRF
ncbi:MAG: hypothetical protein NTW90_01305 [Nitrosospira sp.]|nr:hypothetical protein [Nitrosospira sp.]